MIEERFVRGFVAKSFRDEKVRGFGRHKCDYPQFRGFGRNNFCDQHGRFRTVSEFCAETGSGGGLFFRK
jgi:hypothetical protein